MFIDLSLKHIFFEHKIINCDDYGTLFTLMNELSSRSNLYYNDNKTDELQ